MNNNPHFDMIRLAFHTPSPFQKRARVEKPVGIKQLLEVYHITFMNGKRDIDYVHPDSLGYNKGDQQGLRMLIQSNRKIRQILNKLFAQVEQDKSDLQLTKTIQKLNDQILISLWLMGYDLALRARFHRLRKKAQNRNLDNEGLINVWDLTFKPEWMLLSENRIEEQAKKLSDSINQRFYLSYKKALKLKGKKDIPDEELNRIGAHLSELINRFNRLYKEPTSEKVRSICLKIATELYTYLWWVVVSDINEHGEEWEEDPEFDPTTPYL